MLRDPSSLALNASRKGASTTSLGNLFQCLTTLTVNNFFLVSSPNLPFSSLKPFPLVLLLPALINSLSLSFSCPEEGNKAGEGSGAQALWGAAEEPRWVTSYRTRGNILELCQGIHRQVVESLSLEVFKKCVDVAMRYMV